MADDLKEISRTLKDIDRNLGKISQALTALNSNYVEVNRRPNDIVIKEDDGGNSAKSFD